MEGIRRPTNGAWCGSCRTPLTHGEEARDDWVGTGSFGRRGAPLGNPTVFLFFCFSFRLTATGTTPICRSDPFVVRRRPVLTVQYTDDG